MKLAVTTMGCVLGIVFSQQARAITATNLSCFEGIEMPKVQFLPAQNKFAPNNFINITNVSQNVVRMTLRYRGNEWWDGDRNTVNRDRQRAEVKGLGPHQQNGETFEYGTTWRTDEKFETGRRFCHVFQLKATDGDDGAPLVVLSVLSSNRAAVRYWSGNAQGFSVAREFAWKPGQWQTVKIRITTSMQNDGAIMVSVDGDKFQGVTGISLYRPESSDYRPKWGFYRGVGRNMPLHDDYVEHKSPWAEKIPGHS